VCCIPFLATLVQQSPKFFHKEFVVICKDGVMLEKRVYYVFPCNTACGIDKVPTLIALEA
jgi:hypothetical protein